MPRESRVKQSFKTFAADVDQALQSNFLSLSETEELSSAFAVIQARLNSHRNSFVPINKLPSEILARIFEFVITPQPFHNRLSEWPASVPPRQATWNRRLVLVCARWSAIATRCQRMWYYVVDDDVDAPKKYSPRAVLRRSGSAVPLHLWMTSTPESLADPQSISRWVIKNQPLRVEALYASFPDKMAIEIILKSLATPLPSLRLLSVDGAWDYCGPLAPGMPTIFGGGALGLKALVWSLSIPFIPGNVFPSLTDLYLNDLASDVLTLDRLLQLLSNCPRLETFILSENSLDDRSDVMRDRRPVRLDHLRALWMHSMPLNTALTALSYLQVPTDATVRLSDLAQHDYHSDPAKPPTERVAFLQQMDELTSLDVITCRKRTQSVHFIVIGACSRFWIHFETGGPNVRSYVRYLYGMLPKKNLRTLRFSMQDPADFVLIRDMMRDPLPSLNTLFVRHSKTTSPSCIVTVSRALYPGGAPEPEASDTQSDSASEPSSDDYSEGRPDSDLSYDSDDDDSDSDLSFNTTDPPRRTHDVPAEFPIDLSGVLPAPQLKVVGLEVRHAAASSLRPFVRMVEARKKCGHPLDAVLCSLEGVDQKDVDELKEHVVNGVHAFQGNLWFPTIDDGWLMKNDHWRLYPEPSDDCEDDYAEWGFSMVNWWT